VVARSGFSTVDGVIAITLLSLAALGAAGAMARSARVLGVANREAGAARITEQAVEQLRGVVRLAGDRCGAIGPGSVLTGSADVFWSPLPVTGGINLQVITTQSIVQRPRSDTLWLFLSCR
jgi:hypothetical protein